jgi:hypothetical protein
MMRLRLEALLLKQTTRRPAPQQAGKTAPSQQAIIREAVAPLSNVVLCTVYTCVYLYISGLILRQ